MTSSLLAESCRPSASVLTDLRLYWPSCSVSAEFVAHMIRTVFDL